METKKSSKPRGFAGMDRAKVSEIARKGGKAAHAAGTAHEFTSDEARTAGAKGGISTHAKRRAAKGLAPAATVSGAKDPNREVRVSCASASGCEGVAKAKDAGLDFVGELPTKASKAPKAPIPVQTADEDPEDMGSGSCAGGCGSH